jgi:hypothetical protein
MDIFILIFALGVDMAVGILSFCFAWALVRVGGAASRWE